MFITLWTEPLGETNTKVIEIEPNGRNGRNDKAISAVRFGERVYSKVRRFVVIREGSQCCSALPIVSYGKQGVGKEGVKKSDHCIIYTGRTAPEPMPSECPTQVEAKKG